MPFIRHPKPVVETHEGGDVAPVEVLSPVRSPIAPMLTSPQMVREVMNRPLPDAFIGRAPREKPVKGLTYAREWNTIDFLGKYHVARFQNQSCPTPGTTIIDEMQHKRMKDADLERFDKDLADRAKKRRVRVQVRTENALFQTKIELGTMIGAPLEQAEEIMRSKQTINDNKPRFPDSRKEIARFFKNVTSGNDNYIVYAATLGFKSFDFQDEQTGDSALQIAVRQGNVKMVQELLKYTADPNLRNNLGDTAIHDAWFSWHPVRFNRTREERIDQETRTYEIILALLSYGAHVDSVNQKGESPLHIACRMGTVQIVTLLLGFRANVLLRDKANKLAAHVAVDNGRREMSKLFTIWEAIRHRFVHMDFLVVWRAFLRDVEALISSNKTAEEILFDLNMEQSVAKVDREVRAMEKGEVVIDDTLMRQTYQQMRNADAEAPKPWDPAWPSFLSQCHEKGIKALLSDEQMEALNPGHTMQKEKEQELLKQKTMVFGETGLTRAQIANKKLPDRIMPDQRPRTRAATPVSASGRRRPSRGRSAAIPGGASNSPSRSPSRAESPGLLVSRFGAGETMSRSTANLTGTTTTESRVSFSLPNISSPTAASASSSSPFTPLLAEESAIAGDGEVLAEPPPQQQRPMSAIQLRHVNAARIVALDARFFRFTKRPATASALFIPLRTAVAPLDGTPEQKSIIRHITSQGKEYELAEKNRKQDLRAALGFEVKEPPRSAMGDYTDAVKVELLNERDKLYNKLNVKPMSDREAMEAMVLAAAAEQAKNGKGSKEAAVATKLSLVQDKRLRFIEDAVAPPERKLTLVERMARERNAKEAADKRERMGISGAAGEAAKAELQAALLAPVDEDDEVEPPPPSSGDHGGIIEQMAHQRKTRQAQKKKARGVHLLMREEVKYGQGRLRSTHNLTGAMEKPWATVSGRYKVRAGDRTG